MGGSNLDRHSAYCPDSAFVALQFAVLHTARFGSPTMALPAGLVETFEILDMASREQEWQFTASRPDAVRAWLVSDAAQSSARVEQRPMIHLLDTYYDTPDWIIHRAGYALRIRRAGESNEATLKSLHPGSATGFVKHRELSESLTEADAHTLSSAKGDVSARVRALTGSRPLEPLFQVQTQRERYALLLADGAESAEIALDSSRFAAPGRPEQTATRIEIECLDGRPDSLQGWIEELSAKAELEPVQISKFQLALAALELTPPSSVNLGDVEIDATTSVRDAALATFRRHLRQMIEHEPGARADEDIAHLHEMRVAARRLDAAIRVYEDHVPRWVSSLRSPLRRLIRAMGATRDLHLQLAHLEQVALELPESQRQSLRRLRDRFEADRRRARSRMLRTLDSSSVQRMLATWVRNLRAPPRTRPVRGQPAIDVFAADAVARHHKKLTSRAKRVTESSSPDQNHQVRGRVKRLRYVVETFAPLYGASAGKFLHSVVRFQNVLGDYQDAQVRISRLTRLASEPGSKLPAETLFIMGQLAERDAHLMRRLQERILKASRRVRGKRWKNLRRLIRERAQAAESGQAPNAMRDSAP